MTKKKHTHAEDPDSIGSIRINDGSERVPDAPTEAGTDPLTALKTERDELEQRLLRVSADYQNFVRRSEQNLQTTRQQALIDVAKALLTPLDHFDHALDVDPQTTTAEALQQGVRIVRDELVKALDQFGVARITAEPGGRVRPQPPRSVNPPAGPRDRRGARRRPTPARVRATPGHHPPREGGHRPIHHAVTHSVRNERRRSVRRRSRCRRFRIGRVPDMPTYEYQCSQCEHRFEEFQSIKAKPLRKCPSCGALKLKRLIGTGAGVIFKGSGFYETDYRSDSYKKSAKAESDAAKPKSDKPDKKPKTTDQGAKKKPATKSSSKGKSD